MTWIPLTRSSIADTQSLIDETLGLSRETFRASAFLSQGQGGTWTEAPASKRKEILGKILGLDRFQVFADAVKADRKAAQTRVERLGGILERADVELAERSGIELLLVQAGENAEQAEADRTDAAEKLEQQTLAMETLEAQRAARAEAAEALARAESAASLLEARDLDARAAAADLAATKAALAGLTTPEQLAAAEAAIAELDARAAAYQRAVAEREQTARDAAAKTAQRDAILAQAQAKDDEGQKLDDQAAAVDAGELAHCVTCEQELGADAKMATLANLRARAIALDEEQRALLEQASGIEIPAVPAAPEPPVENTDARTTLQTCRADALTRERLAGQAEMLRGRAAAAPPENEVAAARAARDAATKHLDELPPQPPEAQLAEARAETLRLKAAVETAGARVTQAATDHARAQAKAERLGELAKATAAERVEREKLQRQVDRLLMLERAFGRDGIPALIVQGAAIPAIETEANRLLGELGGKTKDARVELRTARALASGGLSDALDIIVHYGQHERSYEMWSGGERTRLNVALRIALSLLLATRRGADSGILTLDEPSDLDEDGMAALVAVLSGLSERFSRVYLISHVPDLKHAFDNVIEVVPNGNGLSSVRSAA